MPRVYRHPRRRRADRAGQRRAAATTPVGDLTREPLEFPADRDLRLQALARGDEGFLLALGYSTQRGYRPHPSLRRRDPHRRGRGGVRCPRSSASPSPLGRDPLTECQMVNQFTGSAKAPPQFTRGYGLVFGQTERKAMSMALVDRALRAREFGEDIVAAGAGRGIRHLALRQRPGDRLRRAPEAAALRRFPGRTRPGPRSARRVRGRAGRQPTTSRAGRRPNERAHVTRQRLQLRLSRRADQADDPPRDPQGIAIPGYQVPFASAKCRCPMAGAPAACR